MSDPKQQVRRRPPSNGDYEVGYKRPSKAHQFPKGYSPNRNYRGRPKKKIATLAEEIEKAFATSVRVRLKPGRPAEAISVFELITARLYEKAIRGDDAALTVLEKYKIYAAGKPIVKLVEDPPSKEELANSYARLLEEGFVEAAEGKNEFKIDNITFTPASSLQEASDAYYRWFDEWNNQYEKKVQRRKLF